MMIIIIPIDRDQSMASVNVIVLKMALRFTRMYKELFMYRTYYYDYL